MKPASPYLTAPEAAAYLKFPTVHAFYCHRSRTKLKAYRRGGKLLFKQSDLDASLYEERPERLRRVVG
jgi:hypothetical protein